MKHHLLRRLMQQTALLTAGLGFAAMAQALPYTNLFVFGDSLSDIGNDLALTGGFVPNKTIYTNGIDTGRFTNGLSYADYLATGLGLSLKPSTTLGGTDYAYGGARTSSLPTDPAFVRSFNQQISDFDATHTHADAGALYVLWIGANDMSDAITNAAISHSSAPINAAISNTMLGISSAILDLSSRGATHFLIPNLPDLSLTPAVRSVPIPGLSALAQDASNAFNGQLATILGQASLASLDIRGYDVYAAQTAITNNPAAYGFTNVSDACYTGDVTGAPRGGAPLSICGDPSKYMYWDYEHPTAALHAVLGAQALAAAVPEPSQWLLLTLGVATLAGVRRARRPG